MIPATRTQMSSGNKTSRSNALTTMCGASSIDGRKYTATVCSFSLENCHGDPTPSPFCSSTSLLSWEEQMPTTFQPMPLSRRAKPFNHPEWLFELKYDGFRALARVQRNKCELISRNGHPFASFSDLADSMATLAPDTLVLDGKSYAWTRRGAHSSMTYFSAEASRTFSRLIFSTRRAKIGGAIR